MIYQFRCPKCQKIYDVPRAVAHRDDPYACIGCGIMATRLMAPQKVRFNIGKGARIPGWCHSLDNEPVYIKNKHAMREECKARDLTPAGLD